MNALGPAYRRSFRDPRRPALFQLRHHFVLEERIGIQEMGAEQFLTNRGDRADGNRSRPIRRRCIKGLRRGRHLRHRRLALAQAGVAIVPEHFSDLGQKPAFIHVAPPRLTPYGSDVGGTVRSLTLSRSDTWSRADDIQRDLFCIRRHFVLEERIGVGKIGAKRILTIDESARRLFSDRTHRRHDLRRQEFRNDGKHDDDLAARFASKTVGGDRRHRLGASWACHAGRTLTAHVRSCMFIVRRSLRLPPKPA